MITYAYEPENEPVVARLEDGTEIGELTYYVENGVWHANHTGVDPTQRGKNVAGNMFQLFIEEARKQNVKVKPLCSYVVKGMVGKEEYADLLA